MEFPLVSIVVITYNSSKYVLEALDSIYSQSYENIELIISDDCSKDDTVTICEEWCKHHTGRFVRSKVLRANENTGVSANFNRGVSVTNGEYIKILAGDDILLKDSITTYVNYVIENPDVEWLYCKMIAYKGTFDQDNIDVEFLSNSYLNEEIGKFDLSIDDIKKTLAKRNFLKAPASFISKNALKEVSGCDERYPMCEDYSLCMRLLEAGYRPYFYNKEAVGYRRDCSSISTSSKKNLFNFSYLMSEYGIEIKYCFKYLSKRERFQRSVAYNMIRLMYRLGLTKPNVINNFFYRLAIRIKYS